MALWAFRKRRAGDIHSVVRAGRAAEVRRLLAGDPDLIDARTDFGATPLHCAAYEGHVEIVRLLLDLGADPRAEDINGQTALDVARAMENAEVIGALTAPARSPGPRGPSRTDGQTDKPAGYDVFISYKSEDVDLARTVADHLIASGQRVWFAEYEILLHDRDRFQAAIDRGIRESRYGLAFLDDVYATSKHCGREIVQLVARDPDSVLVARIPDAKVRKARYEEIPIDRALEAYRRQDGPAFTGILDTLGLMDGTSGPGNRMLSVPSILAKATAANTLAGKGRDVNAILGFVENRIGRPVTKMSLAGAGSDSFWGSILGADFSLDVTGWRRIDPGSRAIIDKGQGAQFERDAGKERLLMNLYFDRDTSEEGKSRLRPPSPDDRELYEALREYAKKHMMRLNARIKGVHLLFHGGFSQLALTYQLPGYWTRKYSVTVNHPQIGKPVEFVFTFGYTGSFEGYCLNTHVMDSFVKSLKWD